MPQLDSDKVRVLLQVLCETRDDELTCDECLPKLAEWVEQELAGKDPGEAMKLVSHHLTICPECVEELDALRAAIEALRPQSPS